MIRVDLEYGRKGFKSRRANRHLSQESKLPDKELKRGSPEYDELIIRVSYK
jgi:hypothetical protein